MFHSRALLAPAFAIRRLGKQPRIHIVHIDAHDDLMAPLLSRNASNEGLFNSALGCSVDTADPDSINAAIDRGAISKGSFLTAFLLMSGSPGRLFHVKEDMRDAFSWLRPLPMNFALGGVPLERTGVDFHETDSRGAWYFSESKTVPRQIECEANDRIWLDVDLDAFCNRYDGDSDNRFKTVTESERIETSRRIESFLTELGRAQWVSRIEAVSVAISPSFFPSDYWADAIPNVCAGIESVISGS